MSAGELIAVIIVFTLAGILLITGVMHFKEKGVLLNNSYLFASREQRETMNKKPYYRQTAIIFCILSAVFIVVGVSHVFRNDSILMIEIPLIASAMIYAIVSSVRINKGGKK